MTETTTHRENRAARRRRKARRGGAKPLFRNLTDSEARDYVAGLQAALRAVMLNPPPEASNSYRDGWKFGKWFRSQGRMTGPAELIGPW